MEINYGEIRARALDIARHEIEIGAGEEGENNAGPFIEKYLNGIAEPPANWCAAFVSWCYMMAFHNCIDCQEDPFVREISNLIPPNLIYNFYTLSARNLLSIFKKKNWYFGDIEDIGSGDLIFFWRESPTSWMGHVGFVESIDSQGTHPIITTIEGNKGKFPAKVREYQYIGIPEQLLGFGRFGGIK